MAVCEFLAEFLGIFIMVVSAVFLGRHEGFNEYIEEFKENTVMRYNVAFAELGLGLAIVLLHNVWTFGYRGVITVLGWLMVIEALFHLVATEEQEEQLISSFNKQEHWKFYGAAGLLTGLYLLTKGFTGF